MATQWNFVIPGNPHWTLSLTRIFVLSVIRKYSQTSGWRSNPNRNNGKQSAGFGNFVNGWTSKLKCKLKMSHISIFMRHILWVIPEFRVKYEENVVVASGDCISTSIRITENILCLIVRNLISHLLWIIIYESLTINFIVAAVWYCWALFFSDICSILRPTCKSIYWRHQKTRI